MECVHSCSRSICRRDSTPINRSQSVRAGTSAAIPQVIAAALGETDRGASGDEAVDHFLKLAEKMTVVAVGPGLTIDDERTRRFVRAIVERRTTPCGIDPDGLNALAPWDVEGSDEHPLILPPHAGEVLRLLGTSDKSALDDRVA